MDAAPLWALFGDGNVNTKSECSAVVLRLLLCWLSASNVDFVHARLCYGFRQLQRHSAVAGYDLEAVLIDAVQYVVVAVVAQVLVSRPDVQDVAALLGLVHGHRHLDQVPVGALVAVLMLRWLPAVLPSSHCAPPVCGSPETAGDTMASCIGPRLPQIPGSAVLLHRGQRTASVEVARVAALGGDDLVVVIGGRPFGIDQRVDRDGGAQAAQRVWHRLSPAVMRRQAVPLADALEALWAAAQEAAGARGRAVVEARTVLTPFAT